MLWFCSIPEKLQNVNQLAKVQWVIIKKIILIGVESPEKKKNVDAAKLAEQAERYDDMVSHMKSVAEMKIPLSSEVSITFKSVDYFYDSVPLQKYSLAIK